MGEEEMVEELWALATKEEDGSYSIGFDEIAAAYEKHMGVPKDDSLKVLRDLEEEQKSNWEVSKHEQR